MGTAELAIEHFLALNDAQCDAQIKAAKAALGEQLVILGHHYQRDEVFKHADYSGDSLKLSRQAAQSGAEYIVFCGVHFMAEVADILTAAHQKVILPDLAAGCSMADMASLAKVEAAWQALNTVIDADNTITPITYINSSAALKAFCGRHGGIVCTSANAQQVLQWALARREKVLFFPDQHLGRNSGYRLDIPLEQMVVWDFNQPSGGLTPEQIQHAQLMLWKGFCSVHQLFEPEDIEQFRKLYPQGKVIAHPESSFEVCQQADAVGSTEAIIQTIHDSPPGTHWLVGTELNLVNRLAQRYQSEGKSIQFMSPIICMCSTMFRIDPPHLLWVLEHLLKGQVINQIQVPAEETEYARLALERMLALN